MPGNKTIFAEAVKKGHNAAWDGDWKKAIAEYRRALVEMPQDAAVHLSLSHALEESGVLEDALHECRIASKLQPHDPQPLLRAASLQEKLGKLSEAAGTYVAIAEISIAQKAVGKAVEMWQRAATLEPERTDVHQKLADIYERGSRHSLAAKEYVTLARIHQKRGDKPKTRTMAQKALALDPQNSTARTLAEQFQANVQTEEEQTGPIDQAEKAALSRLAETLLEERQPKSGEGSMGSPGGDGLSSEEANALIARAVDAQSQHQTSDAIECYRKLLEGGVARPEVKFNLGLLYSETARHEQAIELLLATVNVADYSLASHFALGQAYRALGNIDASLEHFLQVTKIVDMASVGREKADELISVYEGLAESYVSKGDREKAESFGRALEQFLTSKGWEDKVRDVRGHLESLYQDGAQVALAEVIEVPESAQVLEALSLSQDYARRSKFNAAEEECLRAIELAPLYLPAHIRLAEILAMEGHVEEACVKYQTLADLADARGEKSRADGFRRQALKLTSHDNGGKAANEPLQETRPESSPHQLTEQVEQESQAVVLDAGVGSFSDRLGLQIESASIEPISLESRHQLAETHVHQGNLTEALEEYKGILKESPEDERAQTHAIDLLLRLKQTDEASSELDHLMKQYADRGQIQNSIAVLEALIQSHPSELSPRAHLGNCFVRIGDKDKALKALDALGEMQMNAGQVQAAAVTIRQIIALDPPQVEEYKQLLKQIPE